ncbi:MAG: hypothetical protein LBL79_02815 [Prevotella sp.]|jgi:hypothetical protein|nr:hypothetical protein [Prevotella sp.]
MRELFPILVTLSILIAVFGLWYSARRDGWFVDKRADDFSICRTSPDTLSFFWKYPNYGIRGCSTFRHNDDILHISFDLSKKSNRDRVTMAVDTQDVKRIELYGTVYTIKDIPCCR